MPLLGKESFVRQHLSDDVSSEDEIFYCKATNEAFITYDQFFERQILCSSMVWTCSMTGRTGLTYDEALESERTATETLTAFPNGLQIPILFLMNYINESKIGSIVDMIYTFVSNRYFVAEEIENIVNTKRKRNGKVFRVIAPTDQEISLSEQNQSSQTRSIGSIGINSTLYKYEIIDDENNRHIVGADRMTRTKGLLTKDKVRLFLKQHLISTKRFQPMAVKESSKQKFGLSAIQWSHIFCGPEPHFEDQTVVNKDKQKVVLESKRSVSDKSSGSLNSSQKSTISRKSDSKKNMSSTKSSVIHKQKNSSPEERQRIREKEKQQKFEQKVHEKEQKKQLEENKKEWNVKRDDLACDDLKPLPKPIAIKCQIPVRLFADSVVVMEFIHNFNDLFDLKTLFPFGLTFDLMEHILLDVDIEGPFGHLIRVLLISNLTLEEETSCSQNTERDDSSDDGDREEERKDKLVEGLGEEERKMKFTETTGDKNANYYYNWIQTHLGLQLSQLNVDSFTLTEVFRLYLLSSGAEHEIRCKQRDLYHSREEPVIEFVAQNETILTKLESNTIFDLNAEERLKILHLLIHQMLSFVETRDRIDDSFDRMSKLRKSIRDIQMEFNKWSKDKALNRLSNKKSSQNNDSKASIESQSQTSGSATEQLDEYRKEKSQKEEEKRRNCCEIRSQIRKLQACYGLKPIGFDRAFRRYWVFESLPGLFVEHHKHNIRYTDLPFGPCLEEPTPNQLSKPNCFEEFLDKTDAKQRSLRDDTSTTSDKENESNAVSAPDIVPKSLYLSHFDRCSANIDTCAVHGLSDSDQRLEWSFYHSSEDLNELIASLNCRGFRESELMVALNRDRSIIIEYMNKCQPNKLNEDLPVPETRRSQRLQEDHVRSWTKGKPSYSCGTIAQSMASALRHSLKNLEEQIFAGSLAFVTDVSRKEWKEMVERTEGMTDKRQLIEALGKCILVLTQSIRSMCLSFPLNDNEDNSVYPLWAYSLSNSTSLSQMFVYLSILEKSVNWGKSAQKAYCKLCRRKCDPECILLCDSCNRGHHTYCLEPKIHTIPREEWLCPGCAPKFKPQTPKKDRTCQKASYDSLSDFDTSEDNDFDDESDSQSECSLKELSNGSNGSVSASKDIDICAHCQQTDPELQLMCAKCHHFYHLNCANVKRITRSDWFCTNCSINGLNEKKRKQNKIIDLNISDDSQTSETQTQSKRSKKSRYSQDFDYMNGSEIEAEEEEEKLTPNTSTRRRCDKSSAALRKALPLDFGLCEDILKQLQRHKEGWPFMTRPNQAPNYNKVIKSYVDFGQLISGLNQGKYRSNLQFFRDVLLMLNNAAFYNPTDSPEYKSCQCLAQYFEQLLKQYGLDLNHYSVVEFSQ